MVRDVILGIRGKTMACGGTCKIEQNEVRNPRYDGPYYKVGEPTSEEVDETLTDEQIWNGQNLDDFTRFHPPTLAVWYRTEWDEGVTREFPPRRALDCTDRACKCMEGDPPTVIEDWSDWTKYDVHVRLVMRIGGNTPGRMFIRRYLLKGTVEQRQRVVQGLCRRDPEQPVIAPLRAAGIPGRFIDEGTAERDLAGEDH